MEISFLTESSLLSFAEFLGGILELPACFEFVGDVGAGKTTFTRGLGKGLGVEGEISSPSFVVEKRYSFSRGSAVSELIHYDFYRLPDPGVMSFELAEALSLENSVVVVEWAGSVVDILPENKISISFKIEEDGSRTLTFKNLPKNLQEQLGNFQKEKK